MAAPDIPWADRPWRQQRGLSEEEFKVRCAADACVVGPGAGAGDGQPGSRRGALMAPLSRATRAAPRRAGGVPGLGRE